MANTLNLGNGNWGVKKDSLLAYNSENNNFKPLPFDFTRASSGTVVNKDGLIETVGSGEPRIDFLGNTKGALKLEPQRSNSITYSEDFTNAIWTNTQAATIVNPTSDLSPDGTLSGNEFNEGATDSRRGIFEDVTVTANTSYTLSVFVKKGTSDYLRLVIANGLDSGLDWTAIQVNLSNNSLSTKNGTSNLFTDISSFISDTDYNGYYRVQLTAKHPTTTTLRIVFGMSDGVAIYSTNSIARRDYVGVNKYLYVWGAQLEEGSYATSYIPTQGSIKTRLADVCSQTPPDGIIGQTEGVAFADFVINGNSNPFTNIINTDKNTISSISINFLKSTNKISASVFADVDTTINSFSAYTNGQRLKVAFLYKSGSILLYVNGVLEASSTTTFSFSQSITELFLNDNVTYFGYQENLSFNDVRVYNTALTDSELAILTTI